MSTPTVTPAGWYNDPEHRGERYWDGQGWTDQHAPQTQKLATAAPDPGCSPGRAYSRIGSRG